MEVEGGGAMEGRGVGLHRLGGVASCTPPRPLPWLPAAAWRTGTAAARAVAQGRPRPCVHRPSPHLPPRAAPSRAPYRTALHPPSRRPMALPTLCDLLSRCPGYLACHCRAADRPHGPACRGALRELEQRAELCLSRMGQTITRRTATCTITTSVPAPPLPSGRVAAGHLWLPGVRRAAGRGGLLAPGGGGGPLRVGHGAGVGGGRGVRGVWGKRLLGGGQWGRGG